jgi:hypothetical protein
LLCTHAAYSPFIELEAFGDFLRAPEVVWQSMAACKESGDVEDDLFGTHNAIFFNLGYRRVKQIEVLEDGIWISE